MDEDDIKRFYKPEVLSELGILNIYHNKSLVLCKLLIEALAVNSSEAFEIVLDKIPEQKYSSVVLQIFSSRFKNHSKDNADYVQLKMLMKEFNRLVKLRNTMVHSDLINTTLDDVVIGSKTKSNQEKFIIGHTFYTLKELKAESKAHMTLIKDLTEELRKWVSVNSDIRNKNQEH